VSTAKKGSVNLLDERARILQSKLVFVNALPTNTASKEVLLAHLEFIERYLLWKVWNRQKAYIESSLSLKKRHSSSSICNI
jgi:hypothetical protein